MKILAVETSGSPAGAAVADENGILGEFYLNNKMNHSQTIMPMVSCLLEMTSLEVSDMDYIACSSGPGSFTGLRIGAAAAKGMAHGAKKPIIMVPTLDALAYNVLDTGDLIVPIMDARRGQVYTAIYRGGKEGLTRLGDFTAEPFDQLIDRIRELGERAVFLGDGCPLYENIITKEGHFIAPCNMNLQRAAAVAALALVHVQAGLTVGCGDFKLIYLRKPQAEREYEEKMKSGGN